MTSRNNACKKELQNNLPGFEKDYRKSPRAGRIFASTKPTPRNLPVISLFSGAGGLDLGIMRAGRGRIVFKSWVEREADCRSTLSNNFSETDNSDLFFDDICKLNPRDIMDKTGLKAGETFLLIGGPPCQAFSTAGLRGAINDDRGMVVHNYFEVLKVTKPRFFVFENVRGLLSAALKHRPLHQRLFPQEIPEDEDSRLGSVMNKLIIPTFQKLGYEVIFGLLNAADYGTAQVRHRLFILGSREREFKSSIFRKQTGRPMMPLDIVPPTHHQYAPYEPIRPWRTLRDAIGDFVNEPLDPRLTYSYSPERASIFAQIPPGKNWTYVRDNPDLFPDGFLARIMGNGLYSGGGKIGFWRRLSWNETPPTITAQPQQLATSLCHPDFERPLSIPEYAALQDFPSDYKFYGSKSSIYRQIGNAVPVRLATAVGCAILAVAGEH